MHKQKWLSMDCKNYIFQEPIIQQHAPLQGRTVVPQGNVRWSFALELAFRLENLLTFSSKPRKKQLFLFCLSDKVAHSLTSVENLRQNPTINNWKFAFCASQSRCFVKRLLSFVDVTRGDSRRHERMWTSTSLASCVENIHEVNSFIWSSFRLLVARLDLFTVGYFEDDFDLIPFAWIMPMK